MSKMPYISDKRLYSAVMFACKMIRENRGFNKAVEIAADYYHVSEESVASEIRKRQAAGQSGKSKGKYKYYTCCSMILSGDEGYVSYRDPYIKKAFSSRNVKLSDRHRNSYFEGSYGRGGYEEMPHVMNEYSTEKEAIEHLEEDFNELKSKEI